MPSPVPDNPLSTSTGIPAFPLFVAPIEDSQTHTGARDRATILQDLASELAMGRADTIVLGAGFSKAATGMDWPLLMERVKTEMISAGKEVPNDWASLSYPAKAQAFLDAFSGQNARCRLEDLVIRETKAREGYEPSLEKHILALRTRYVITTNYDDLIESTLANLGIPHVVIADEESAERFVNKLPEHWIVVVKMHGDPLARNMVISQSDYDSFAETRPHMNRLVSSLLTAKRVITYGFGLSDPNVARLMPTACQQHRGFGFAINPGEQQIEFAQAHGLEVISFTSPDEMMSEMRELAGAGLKRRSGWQDPATQLASAPELAEHLEPLNRIKAAIYAAAPGYISTLLGHYPYPRSIPSGEAHTLWERFQLIARQVEHDLLYHPDDVKGKVCASTLRQ